VSEMEGYLAQGFTAVLAKPFDQAALQDCLLKFAGPAPAPVTGATLPSRPMPTEPVCL
jgi:hypothetical protein